TEFEGPVYLRLNGAVSMPIVGQDGTEFEIGKARVLSKGRDVTFVANGSMVARCVKAAELLAEEGIDVGVANFHTFKPLDSEALLQIARTTSLIVTAEEHSTIGGLGSAVAEVLAEQTDSPRLLRIGVPDAFPKVGNYGWVLTQCGFDPEDVATRVLGVSRKNRLVSSPLMSMERS
ncbi:MAG: hypothetical protein KC561_14930, partial [Myxococcales bacterium]|nr:hypothetical protein [Myxococcales bacterium]